VLVNAVINSFRLVDHVVVMTRGGSGQRRRAAALLHLRRGLQVLRHRLRRRPHDGPAGDPGRGRGGTVRVPRTADPLPVSAGSPLTPGPRDGVRGLETAGAWLLGLLWILPLAYATWTAFHGREYSARFVPTAPWTLGNFVEAWNAAPFARYFLNTFLLVTMVLAAQLVLCTLAAYA